MYATGFLQNWACAKTPGSLLDQRQMKMLRQEFTERKLPCPLYPTTSQEFSNLRRCEGKREQQYPSSSSPFVRWCETLGKVPCPYQAQNALWKVHTLQDGVSGESFEIMSPPERYCTSLLTIPAPKVLFFTSQKVEDGWESKKRGPRAELAFQSLRLLEQSHHANL